MSRRVEELLSKMTLEEKAAQTDMIRGVTLAEKVHPAHFCSVDDSSDFVWERVDKLIGAAGIGFVHDVYSPPAVLNKLQRYSVEKTRLGIPCIFTGEALHGLSWPGAMSFPMPIALGAAFDPELTKEVGRAIGAETRSLGIHEILAPNLDVARDPRWGRMEETFGEDTFLSRTMARAIISGEQGEGPDRPDAIICEPKHYFAHGFPEGGLNCASARCGEREARSQYLPVFEAGIKEAGAWNAMAAYNNIDGIPLVSSRHWLTDVLKGELGLKGYIRSDFGAVNRLKTDHHMTVSDEDSIEPAFNAGLDVSGFDYSGDIWQKTLCRLVREGRVSEERLNDAVRRILSVKEALGLFEHPYTDEEKYCSVIRCEAHHATALKAARESVVLLKNDGILPLSGEIKTLALIGPSSDNQRLGSYSSVPWGYKVESLKTVLERMLPGTRILQEDGCEISGDRRRAAAEGQQTSGSWVSEASAVDAGQEESMARALAAAEAADAVILVCGDDTVTSGEGMDRAELKLYGPQRELIRRAGELGKPCVLVLEVGKSVDLTQEEPLMNAVLLALFGGEHGARAIAEALLGQLNPSGHLPVSFPKSVGELPYYYSMLPGSSREYLEGAKGPRYPFGYGLSYTCFALSDMKAEVTGNIRAAVSFTVTNTGEREGCALPQLYVEDPVSSVVTPDRRLAAFSRVELRAGESRRVEFILGKEAFRLLNEKKEWVVEPGAFILHLGFHCQDDALACEITLEGE